MTRGLYPHPPDARDAKDLGDLTKRLSTAERNELAARRQHASLVLGRISRLQQAQRDKLDNETVYLGTADFSGALETAEAVIGEAAIVAIAQDLRRAFGAADLHFTEEGMDIVYRAALAEAAQDGIKPDAYARLREQWVSLTEERG